MLKPSQSRNLHTELQVTRREYATKWPLQHASKTSAAISKVKQELLLLHLPIKTVSQVPLDKGVCAFYTAMSALQHGAPLGITWPCSPSHVVLWGLGCPSQDSPLRCKIQPDLLSFWGRFSLQGALVIDRVEVSGTSNQGCLMLQHFISSIGARLQTCCCSHLLGLQFSDAGARSCTASCTAIASADWTETDG